MNLNIDATHSSYASISTNNIININSNNENLEEKIYTKDIKEINQINEIYKNYISDFSFPHYSQPRLKISKTLINFVNSDYFNNSIKDLKNLNDYYFLDLGAGAGINSIYMNKKGFNVTIVDKEEILRRFKFINTIINLQYSNELKFNLINDLEFYKITSKYDLILSSAHLHALRSKEEQFNSIKQMQSITNINGYNIFSTYINDYGLKPNNLNIFSLIKSEELLSNYLNKDWKIIHSKFNKNNLNNYIGIFQRIN